MIPRNYWGALLVILVGPLLNILYVRAADANLWLGIGFFIPLLIWDFILITEWTKR